MIVALLALAAALPQPVFACSLGAKEVRVTRAGAVFSYTFGRPGRPELRLTGSAAAGDVHFMAQRYAGPEYQLRFSHAPYSYVVYSMTANPVAGSHAVSGLVVMRGTTRIADLSCRRFAAFTSTDDLLALPPDTDAYTAM